MLAAVDFLKQDVIEPDELQINFAKKEGWSWAIFTSLEVPAQPHDTPLQSDTLTLTGRPTSAVPIKMIWTDLLVPSTKSPTPLRLCTIRLIRFAIIFCKITGSLSGLVYFWLCPLETFMT